MAQKTPAFVWVPALVFTTLLLGFLMTAFYTTPNFTETQRGIVILIFPILAAFATLFMGGAVMLEITGKTPAGVSFSISAVAGVAVFIICYFHPPSFVKKFVGYSVRPTVDFITSQDQVLEETGSAKSATIYTGQNGDTKGTSVEVELPPGAYDVTSQTDWTCNCTKASRSQVIGNRVVANGTITSPEKLWGPRVWGELWLNVHWKRNVPKTQALTGVKLNPSVLYSTDVTYPLPQGTPEKAHIEFSRDSKTVYDVIDVERNVNDPGIAKQSSQKGEFMAALSSKDLVISTVPH